MDYFAYSTGAGGTGTSLKCGRGRNLGGFSSPVQQPQEERATPPATADNMTRIRSVFIMNVKNNVQKVKKTLSDGKKKGRS